MKNSYLFVIAYIASLQCLNAQQVILMQEASISQPTDIKHAGDHRLFVTDRSGTVQIIDSNGTLQSLPFLNITDRITSANTEQGLLGIAFDPAFKTNGFFYVDYTRQSDGWTRISRFHLTGNASHCDSTTEQILLTIYQPYTNHNGGSLQFGADHYLYIGMGDGGSGGDPGNRAQNLDSLLGKILRIDVSDSSVAYKIPPDNPFASLANTNAHLVWDYGVRNPWRFSFDRQTHELWIGDVGQNSYEEIDREAVNSGGNNYGWRCYEGDSAYNTSGCGPASNYIFPIYTYNHSGDNCSITGGYRYRGSQFPSFAGKYFFADYCVGTLRYLTETSPGVYISTTTSADLPDATTFGEDVDGELYVGTFGGHAVYKLCDSSCPTGLKELLAENDVIIYPNPGNGNLNISITNKAALVTTISVTNALGQTVFTQMMHLHGGQNLIPVELKQSAGIYFLSLRSDAASATKMFVVE